MKILSIIITYNSEKWIRKNLQSIGSESDILVLDNGSSDHTLEIIKSDFPHVQIIQNSENLGFAKANNAGFRMAIDQGYDWVYLVNHDAWLAEGCISEMIKVMQNPDYKEYGILSPVHFAGDEKSYDFGFVRFCDIKKLEDYQKNNMDVFEVQEVNGAFMMISKECLNSLKGFDPLFFFYGEDIDFCYRAKKRSHKIGVVTKALAYHDRKNREEDYNRKRNRIIANHLIQFKQIKGSFLESYYKTIYSTLRGYLVENKDRAFYREVIKYFIANKNILKNSFQDFQ